MLNKPFRFSRIILICLLFVGCFYGARQLSAFLHKNPIYFFKNSSEHLDSFPDTEQDTTLPSKPTIVIDPGHGGRDPGKIGINKVLEKDLNLSISFKLQELLQNNGFKVVLTRDKDCDLAINSKKKYKSADLKERVNIITEANPALTISIHQNSFPDASISGPQVFIKTALPLIPIVIPLVAQKYSITLLPRMEKNLPIALSAVFMIIPGLIPAVVLPPMTATTLLKNHPHLLLS